jgi:hypothetical protein
MEVKIVTKLFLKLQEEHEMDVYRIGTHHKNDFNEVMPFVHPLEIVKPWMFYWMVGLE